MTSGVSVRHLIFWGAIAALTVAYCWPGHPSAGSHLRLDVVLHFGLFAALGLIFGFAPEGRVRRLVILGLLAAALEVGQWLIGQFRQIEVTDILSNEAGIAAAALFYRMFGASLRRIAAPVLPARRAPPPGHDSP